LTFFLIDRACPKEDIHTYLVSSKLELRSLGHESVLCFSGDITPKGTMGTICKGTQKGKCVELIFLDLLDLLFDSHYRYLFFPFQLPPERKQLEV